jgi:hypothetical protein
MHRQVQYLANDEKEIGKRRLDQLQFWRIPASLHEGVIAKARTISIKNITKCASSNNVIIGCHSVPYKINQHALNHEKPAESLVLSHKVGKGQANVPSGVPTKEKITWRKKEEEKDHHDRDWHWPNLAYHHGQNLCVRLPSIVDIVTVFHRSRRFHRDLIRSSTGTATHGD